MTLQFVDFCLLTPFFVNWVQSSVRLCGFWSHQFLSKASKYDLSYFEAQGCTKIIRKKCEKSTLEKFDQEFAIRLLLRKKD